MKVKNYQEEFVLNTINLVLDNRKDVVADEILIHDVAAYTLNRIPPRYIMSERGFTRLASEYWIDGDTDDTEKEITSLVELIVLINRGIELVKNRRDRVASDSDQVSEKDKLSAMASSYWHNFPQFIGKVVDQATLEPVSDVSATLYIDGKLSQPAEVGWYNPYRTNRSTQGFYSFWPRPLKSEVESKQYYARVTFEHPDYKEFTHDVTVKIKAEFETNNYIKVEDIFNVGTTYLVKK